MHTNNKRSADVLTTTNGLFKVRNKSRGYFTYRDPNFPKARRWGRVVPNADVVELPIKKADLSKLPSPLPLGVALIRRKVGAVTRSILTGTASAIQHVTGAAGIS